MGVTTPRVEATSAFEAVTDTFAPQESTALLTKLQEDEDSFDVASDATLLPVIVRRQSSLSQDLMGLDEEFKRYADGCEPDPVWQDELRKQVVLMAPITVTYVLEYLPGLVSIMLVGHLEVDDPKLYVDAAALSTVFLNITGLSVGFGLSSALDTLCAQAYGAQRYKKMGIYLQSGCIVVGACLAPLFLMNWYAEDCLLFLRQDPDIARLAGEFSRITVFGMPFLFAYEIMRKLLQATHEIRPLVIIAVLGNVVNIVAGYYLSYHTSMGFHGTALARSLGYFVMPLSYLPYFWVTKTHRRWWPGWRMRAAWRHVPLFLRLGIAGMLMMMMEWWAFEILTIFAGLLPSRVVAVVTHAVLINVVSASYMLFLGMAVAGNIRVGNALGAGMPKHAQLTCKITMTVVLSVAVVLVSSVWHFRYAIPRLLINDDVAIEHAGNALKILAPYMLMDATNCVMQGIYRGIGWQHVAATSNAVAFYVVGIPLSAVFAFVVHGGVVGIWLGFGFGVLTALVVCTVLLLRADWRVLAIEAHARINR